MRLAVLSDVHLSPPGTQNGEWNNPTLLSESDRLLDQALDEIRQAELDHVFVCGDLTNFGDLDTTARAVARLESVDVPVWVVAGNHDVMTDPHVLNAAAAASTQVTVLSPQPQLLGEYLKVSGLPLVSADGGATCTATELPNLPDTVDGVVPVLVTHYPVLSLKPRLTGRGLRYPGDLINRRLVQHQWFADSTTPRIIVHGHIHAAVTLAHAHAADRLRRPGRMAPCMDRSHRRPQLPARRSSDRDRPRARRSRGADCQHRAVHPDYHELGVPGAAVEAMHCARPRERVWSQPDRPIHRWADLKPKKIVDWQ